MLKCCVSFQRALEAPAFLLLAAAAVRPIDDAHVMSLSSFLDTLCYRVRSVMQSSARFIRSRRLPTLFQSVSRPYHRPKSAFEYKWRSCSRCLIFSI